MLKKAKIIFITLLGAISLATGVLAGTTITNTATGTIGGNATVTNGVLTLDKESMSLKKIAFDLAGTRINDGATVASGQIIWVVIYTDNFTPNQVDDIRASDTPGAAFTVVDGGAANDIIQVKTSTCAAIPPATCADDAAWFAAAGVAPYAAWTSLTDAEDGDIAGYNIGGATITMGQPTNGQLNMLKELRYAFRFKVKIN